jgi:hypothetical protein
MVWRRGSLASLVIAGFVFSLVVAAWPADAVSSGEGPVSMEVNGLLPWFDFGISPKRLPRTDPAPARLLLGFQFERGEVQAPALSPVSVKLDRHISLEATGIPICGGLGVQGGVEPARDCREPSLGVGRRPLPSGFRNRSPGISPALSSSITVVGATA